MPEILQNILQAILGFQYLADIIIGLFLLISFFIGLRRGVWRALWRFIFVVITLVLVLLFALEPLAVYLNDGFFDAMGLSVTMSFEGTDYTFNSIQGYLTLVVEYAEAKGTLAPGSIYADADFMASFALAISRAIAWFLLVFITMVLSWIISGLIWLLVFKRLLKGLRRRKLRLVGALIGTVSGYVYAMLFAVAFSPIAGAFGQIANAEEPPYQLSPYVVLPVVTLAPENSFLMSIFDPSNPFNIFTNIATFEHDGNTYNLGTMMSDFVSDTTAPAA
jgi:hypothetical protein